MTASDECIAAQQSERTLDRTTTQPQTAAVGRDTRLLIISELAKISVTEQDTGTMLQKFMAFLVKVFDPADAGILLLYNPSEERLVVEAAHGYDLAQLRSVRIAPGEGRSGRAFETGELILCGTPETIKMAKESITPANRESVTAAGTGLPEPQSSVFIPLTAGDTKAGVLLLENLRGVDAFATTDLPFLQTLADLIALSIESARVREELQSAQALSEANRLKAELISTLAHEMRTPLTSIKGYSTALLMEEISFKPETQREFLRFIDEECDVLQALIHDLLESSIIDAGLLRLEIQPVKLPPLVRNVTDDMARHTQIHHFLIDFAEPFPILDADPNRIVQVVRNLLDNAVKYSPEGGLIVVRGDVYPDEVVISVADQGVGLTPEHVNRLFEKFFRATSLLGRHVVGSGLGLPISRTIVEAHGGRIWAESKVGEGTTLFFTIPRCGLSEAPEEQEED